MQLLKKTFTNPCAAISFGVSIMLTLCGILIICTLISSRCEVYTLQKVNCYEQLGLYYINQFYILTDNKTAITTCGPLLHCNQSCPFLNLEQTYYCYYYENDLYKIYQNNIFGIFLAVCIMLTDVCTMVLFLCFVKMYYNQIYHEFSVPQYTSL